MNNSEISTKVITIRLRVPFLIVSGVVLVFLIGWVFFLGLMVGRGQMDNVLEDLKSEQQLRAEAEQATKIAEEALLRRQEDLSYQEDLRQNTPPTNDPAALAVAAQRDTAQAQTGSQRPQATPQAQRPQAGTAQRQEQQADASGKQYKYTYQVASFAKEEQAKELQTKLKAKSIDSQIETKTISNSTWFRVLVSFQGDEKSVAAMQDMLKKNFKIDSILPRGKSPIGG